MKQSWQQQEEKGNRFFMRLLITIALTCGRRVVRFFLIFIVGYFFIFSPKSRKFSRSYLNRVLRHKPSSMDIYKHLYTFAQVAVDRIYFLSGRFACFDVKMKGEEVFKQCKQTGAILAVSHFGSFDVMRAMAAREQSDSISIYPVLDVKHNATAMSFLQSLDPNLAARVIDARLPGPELMLKLNEVVSAGGFIGLMADRRFDSERTLAQNFLGKTAEFPVSLWEVAALLKVPVISCFGVFAGANQYEIFFQEIGQSFANVPRKERPAAIGAAVKEYVDRLEYFVRKYPFNWFNFYEFWQDEAS